jgi:hypothetical protein
MKKLIYVQVFNYACFHYRNGKDIFGIDTYNLPTLKGCRHYAFATFFFYHPIITL